MILIKIHWIYGVMNSMMRRGDNNLFEKAQFPNVNGVVPEL